MNRQALKHILQSNYDRDQWISTLQFLTGKREYLTVHLTPKTIEINTQEADRIVKTFYQIGSLKTSDGISLPIFEIILEDDIRIEYNKVGVNDFIKKYIIKDAVKGALTTFSYDKDHEKKEWRFSFISKNSANDFFAEAEAEETNPKKYTYIFGTEEEHRTAIERLYNLEQSRFRLEDFFEAFNVEPVSKKFFEEYKSLYKQFSSFLADEKNEYRKIFEAEINDFNSKTKEDVEKEIDKDIRNFVSRLMGRMVFLYFLQKKHWLGASNQKYKDGSSTFLSDLFYNDKESQKDFYQKYLSKIFFEALNTPDRKNEEFTLHDGKSVCIPFLNGGLFEEEQEPKGHRKIQFPDFYFEDLFKFFNGYNFTIYENSPEEHTVAVDPEMLGHIFENLIDYNKDTGTFYTPKEIVQYMTQESLVEYLNTHLKKERKDIENLLKNHYTKPFNNVELEKINQLLDEVKICDPAIGSGAFPMGMLQEIFNLKAVIAYELKKEWNPAQVKQDIIQNSIYGVDLDEGAVEIARLRFWLSLVVDEGTPKALPNLDYKIMQGNSLLESYNDIDLSNLATADEQIISNQQTVLEFGDEYAKEITVFDAVSIEEIQSLIKSYFTKSGNEKAEIKQRLNNIIEGKIHSKIYKEKKRLETLINDFYKKYNLSKDNDLSGFNLKSKELKELFSNKEQFHNLEKIENELISFQHKSERPYFLWHLYFKEIFDNGGFDIVIGNPPYIEFKKINSNIKTEYSKLYVTANRKYDLFGLFIELSSNILKSNGIHTYINPTTFLMKEYGKSIRNLINEKFKIIEIFDFSDFQIFDTAITYTGIFIFQKQNAINYDFIYQKLNGNTTVNYRGTLFENKNSSHFKEVSYINEIKLKLDSWVFGTSIITNLLETIERNPQLKKFTKYTFQGIATGKDEVFLISEDELIKSNIENDVIFPLLKGKDVNKYRINWGKTFVVYPYDKETNKVFTETELKDRFPNLYSYLEKNKNLLAGREYFDNSNKLWFELWNERNLKKFNQIKIVNAEIAPENRFQIDTKGFLGNTKIFSTVLNEEYKDYYLTFLGLLNSKLLNFYHKKIASPKAGGFYDYKTQFIQKYPIKLPNRKENVDFFVKLILFVNSYNQLVVNIIDNNHINNFFEEVIDAIVFEIYFPEEMQEKNITVIAQIEEILQKHQADNFEHLNDEEKRKMIANLYYALKESEVQQKMRQFVTASPDVLKVILQS